MLDIVPVRVGIYDDGPEFEFDAFHDPYDRWNGFLNPYFSKAEAERVIALVESWNDEDFERVNHFYWTTDRQGFDALIHVEYDKQDPKDSWVVEIWPNHLGLYGFTHGWTWSEVSSDDE
jgi:hypothetical protein